MMIVQSPKTRSWNGHKNAQTEKGCVTICHSMSQWLDGSLIGVRRSATAMTNVQCSGSAGPDKAALPAVLQALAEAGGFGGSFSRLMLHFRLRPEATARQAATETARRTIPTVRQTRVRTGFECVQTGFGRFQTGFERVCFTPKPREGTRTSRLASCFQNALGLQQVISH